MSFATQHRQTYKEVCEKMAEFMTAQGKPTTGLEIWEMSPTGAVRPIYILHEQLVAQGMERVIPLPDVPLDIPPGGRVIKSLGEVRWQGPDNTSDSEQAAERLSSKPKARIFCPDSVIIVGVSCRITSGAGNARAGAAGSSATCAGYRLRGPETAQLRGVMSAPKPMFSPAGQTIAGITLT